MSGGDRTHNENKGSVGGPLIQGGTFYGDVMVPHDAPADESLAHHLAREVGIQSRAEEEHWRIGDPVPLRVRWHEAETDLFDDWGNIHRDREHDPVPLSGQFTAIRETFQATGSQRLVILGRAGAGKTVLAHRLILDLLDARGHRRPVPVLFSLNGWNPTVTRLREWMMDRLVRDHPFLDGRDVDATGKRGAEILVNGDWILPVLDGFDELPDRHHRAAIRQISQVQLPLLLTSRPKEYAQAARATQAIGRAAAIEIDDLTLDEAEHHLRRSTTPNRIADWEAVFAQLRTRPQEPASQNLIPVLTTPLMIMLARTHYEQADATAPHELLDTARFPASTKIEQHLLHSYVDTIYAPLRPAPTSQAAPPAWTQDQARHWLGHLATRLQANDTHDFTWWQLPTLIPRPTRILATTTTFLLAVVFTGVLTVGHAGTFAVVLTVVLTVGLTGVFAVVLTLGLAAGFTVRLATGLATGLAIGLAIGLATALNGGHTYGIAGTPENGSTSGLVAVLAFGLMIGVALGTLYEASSVPGRARREPERLRRRQGSLRQRNSRREHRANAAAEFINGLAFGVSITLAIGIIGGVGRGVVSGYTAVSGAVSGLVGGVVIGIAVGVVIGVVNVVVSILGEGLDPHDSDPWDLLSTDRAVTLIRGISAALPISGLTAAIAPYLVSEIDDIDPALMIGFLFGILLALLRMALSAWGNWLLFARVWLPLTGCLPWRPQRFLEDAHERGMLRRAGAAYQFRHAQLRDHLAENHPGKPNKKRAPQPS